MEVIQQNHDVSTAGHLGIRKTLARISQQYVLTFLSMSKNAKRAQTKSIQKAPLGLMGGYSKVNRPWEDISVDIVGPLPRSSSGQLCHSYH